jgi:hypothetical protein
MYREDLDFKEAYEACKNTLLGDKIPWIEYLIQDGLLFKGSQLCIPKCSMRDNLLKEKHSGGLAKHFGHDKTFAQLSNSYYWSSMRVEVSKFVNKCKICQYVKGRQQNAGLYHPLPILEKVVGCNQYGFCIGIA